MTADELEYSLSQYHDGTLGPVERAKLDELLASDADARAILAEYQKLDALVRSTPAPTLNWDEVHSRISAAIANEELPARSYRIGPWVRTIGAIAVAAMVVFLIWPGAIVTNSSRKIAVEIGPVGAVALEGTGSSTVAINSSSQSVIPALAEVQIGPSAEMADAGMRYDDAFNIRPSHIVIAASPEDAQDGVNPAPF